ARPRSGGDRAVAPGARRHPPPDGPGADRQRLSGPGPDAAAGPGRDLRRPRAFGLGWRFSGADPHRPRRAALRDCLENVSMAARSGPAPLVTLLLERYDPCHIAQRTPSLGVRSAPTRARPDR